MCILVSNNENQSNKPIISNSFIKLNFPLNCKWKFIKMITDSTDNTIYAVNDMFSLLDNGKVYLKSDGVKFIGEWSHGNSMADIKIILYAKYSNEQSGMGYNANYELKLNAKIENLTDNMLKIKGICYAFVEEWYYGTLPVLPSVTEMVYPFEWQLVRIKG